MYNHYIYYDESLMYPAGVDNFSPQEAYPEYPWHDALSSFNPVYAAVREIFYRHGLDAQNFGKRNWNPLEQYITPGMIVLLKPNMVSSRTFAPTSVDALITHPSIVRAIIDYVLLALKGEGKVIVADAPVQSCDFSELLDKAGYSNLKKFYASKNIIVDFVDLRQFRSCYDEKGELVPLEAPGDPLGYVTVDMGEKSLHRPVSHRVSKYRVTNYDPTALSKYHTELKNSYLIARTVLSANVVISIPKLKTHRKAGITGAIKNSVGIVGHKDCLPHHSAGAVADGGDEYLHRNIFKKIITLLNERADILALEKQHLWVKLIRFLQRPLHKLALRTEKDPFREGSWYGNDTISRTSLDLVKVLTYATQAGCLSATPQRKTLFFVDAIVAGEGEGPLLPTPKKSGILAFGNNALVLDAILATLMGFNINKIATLNTGMQFEKMRSSIDCLKIISNNATWNGKRIFEFSYNDTLRFISTADWADHIYLPEKK